MPLTIFTFFHQLSTNIHKHLHFHRVLGMHCNWKRFLQYFDFFNFRFQFTSSITIFLFECQTWNIDKWEKVLTLYAGVIALHGPHHSAQKSTTTRFFPAESKMSSNSSWQLKERSDLKIKDLNEVILKTFQFGKLLRRSNYCGQKSL